jgi:heptosyltransferase I
LGIKTGWKEAGFFVHYKTMSQFTAAFWRQAAKIIVVDLGFLGDSIHTIPALWELRRQCPQAQVQVLSSLLGCAVFRLAPCVDRLWPFELDPARRSWREQFKLAGALRREQFDIALNFSGADRSIFWTYLSGARHRIAHAAGRCHLWNSWLIPHWVPRQDRTWPVFEQRRQVLAACGCDLQAPRFDLRLAQEDVDWAGREVPGCPVHLSLNSANPLKEWPVEHYAALIRELWKHDESLAFIASGTTHPRELDRLRSLERSMGDPRFRLAPAGLSLGRLAALLKHCRLHVGPDSGVIHLAMALGVPTVSIFRDLPGYTEWLPAGPDHRHLAGACSCTHDRNSPCAQAGWALCLEKITPFQVAAQVMTLLPR